MTSPEMPQGAVNLALIATTPEQLAAMAEAKGNRDGQRGASATECNGQGMGPSAIAAQQPRGATHRCPIPKKEAPPGPVKEPAPPSRTLTAQRVAPLLPPEQPVRDNPPSSSAAQKLEARLAALPRPGPNTGKLAGRDYREKGR